MNWKYLSAAAIGVTLISGAAAAQTSPPASASPPPASAGAQSWSHWMARERPGQWRASKLTGLNVYNGNNQKIGDINELIVDHDGKIDAVIIGVGGFLGMGEHDVAVPFGELKWFPRAADQATATNAKVPADRGAPATTGTSRDRTASNLSRDYPDHAMLNLTKDQLKAAPEFKYAK